MFQLTKIVKMQCLILLSIVFSVKLIKINYANLVNVDKLHECENEKVYIVNLPNNWKVAIDKNGKELLKTKGTFNEIGIIRDISNENEWYFYVLEKNILIKAICDIISMTHI